MATHEESDFELAQRLHRELNEAERDVILLSDTEDDVKPVELKKVKEEVCFDNQQAITIKRDKSSNTDFYMKAMGTYLDLATSAEWAEVDLASDLQYIFNKLKASYFSPWLNTVAYTIKWDKTCIITDGSSFRFFEPHREVVIASEMMVKPRIQLISVVLHILIHIYLSTCSNGTLQLRSHGDSFRELFQFFNTSLSTEISTSHKLHYSPDHDQCSNQWYQCTGICLNYAPFKGVVRCTTTPGIVHGFWKLHEENCGGQFFKIFEVERFNKETQAYDKKFVRNVRYMFPKPLEQKNRAKPSAAPRELFDLTDDVGEAKVENLCEVVNLDDSEFNFDGLDSPRQTASPEFVQRFVKRPITLFSKCSFCELTVCVHRFQSHVDSCRGFQKKVEFKPKK